MEWLWLRFNDLCVNQLYKVMLARQQVFAVEQNCVYLDADGVDQNCWHLLGIQNDVLQAYCRVVDPGVKYAEVSIGRVLTTSSARGSGAGKKLMAKAIEQTEQAYTKPAIRLSAQQYLEQFYRGFGFETVSEPYDEDGIQHVEMLRKAPA